MDTVIFLLSNLLPSVFQAAKKDFYKHKARKYQEYLGALIQVEAKLRKLESWEVKQIILDEQKERVKKLYRFYQNDHHIGDLLYASIQREISIGNYLLKEDPGTLHAKFMRHLKNRIISIAKAHDKCIEYQNC